MNPSTPGAGGVASRVDAAPQDAYNLPLPFGLHRLTQSLNAARATGSYERKLAALAKVPLLIIDDFGLKPLRAPADEDLHDLIAERYERTATIVTSNLDFTEWDQAFPGNRLLASATVDRLRHNAYCLTLDGASYRAPRQGPNRAKNALASTPKNIDS